MSAVLWRPRALRIKIKFAKWWKALEMLLKNRYIQATIRKE
jgi:hypothetical protein